MPRDSKPHYLKSRDRWYAAIGEPSAKSEGRKRVYFPKSVKTERQAWEYMENHLEAKRASVPSADPSFGDLAIRYERWMDSEVAADRMTEGTLKSRKSMLKLAASFAFRPGDDMGDIPARKLQVDHLEALIQWMSSPNPKDPTRPRYQPHYRKDVAAAVKAMTSWASRPIPAREPRIILHGDPLAGYRPGIAIPRPARYVEQGEIRRFLRWAWGHARRQVSEGRSKKGNLFRRSEADRRFDRIFVLMLQMMRLTGARPKELRTAEWTDIDWVNETITLDPDRHKTGHATGRERTIYLTPSVARILRAIQKLPGRHPVFVFTHALGPGAYDRGGNSEAGEPWRATTAIDRKVREYRQLAAAAGISAAQGQGAIRLVPYLNRHSFITDALLDGGNTADVAKVVGNSAKVIEEVYDHPVKERLAERNREWAAARRTGAKKRQPRG